MGNRINKIIQESVRKVLNEMALIPTDAQGNPNLVKKQTTNAWRIIYRLMDNVKVSMNSTGQGKEVNISISHVDGIIDYIHNFLQNITQHTINIK